MRVRPGKTDAELRRYCVALTNRQTHFRALELELPEFQRLYTILVEMLDHHVPKTSIVSLGQEVFIQFSDVSPQHFLISARKPIAERDFAFIANRTWYGPREGLQSFWAFMVAEVWLNRWWLIIAFLASFLLLFFTHDDELYDLISSLAIQAATVFLSIYLIFAVSQNKLLQSDRLLFEQGVLQKYYSDDRHLSILAIITISLAFLNTSLSHLSRSYDFTMVVGAFAITRHLWLALTTSLTLVLLLDTFLTVVSYYIERSRSVLERDMVDEILAKEFANHYGDVASEPPCGDGMAE